MSEYLEAITQLQRTLQGVHMLHFSHLYKARPQIVLRSRFAFFAYLAKSYTRSTAPLSEPHPPL